MKMISGEQNKTRWCVTNWCLRLLSLSSHGPGISLFLQNSLLSKTLKGNGLFGMGLSTSKGNQNLPDRRRVYHDLWYIPK